MVDCRSILQSKVTISNRQSKIGNSMTGRERILALLDGKPVDSLPFMPITMMFACDQIGAQYRDTPQTTRCWSMGRSRQQWILILTTSIPCRIRQEKRRTAGLPSSSSPTNPCLSMKPTPCWPTRRSTAPAYRSDPQSSPRMSNRLRALALHRQQVGNERLIEGWIEGPIAQAADLRGINSLMTDFYDDPAFVVELFEFVLELELTFARAQVASGAEMIGVGDAAASLVGPRFYKEFVWPYEKRMMDGLREMGARTRLHICGITAHSRPDGALGLRRDRPGFSGSPFPGSGSHGTTPGAFGQY